MTKEERLLYYKKGYKKGWANAMERISMEAKRLAPVEDYYIATIADVKITKLEDLYFGVVLYAFSWSRKDERQLKTYNLFDSLRVLRSVAMWVVETNKDSNFAKEHDFLSWCFGEVRARTEWEFIVCPWGGLGDDDKVVEVGEKVDVYTMYVEPNAKHLRELVDSVSVSSAKKFLAEERNRYRQVRLKNGA